MFSQSAALEPMRSCHSRQKCLKWFWTQEPPCEINTRQVLVSARFSCSCPSPTIFTTVEKQATSANMFRERLWMDRMSKYSTKHSDPMWSKIINTQTIIDIWWHKMMTYECVLNRFDLNSFILKWPFSSNIFKHHFSQTFAKYCRTQKIPKYFSLRREG